MASVLPENPVAVAIASLQALKAEVESKGESIGRPKDCDAVITQVKSILADFCAARDKWWKPEFLEANPVTGFTTRYLHHEADNTLAFQLVSWLPGRDVPPHNHGSWTVATCLEGREKNVWWERTDPAVNDSPLKMVKEQEFGPGETISFVPDTIHSVHNINPDGQSVSVHVYGWHLAAVTEFWVYPEGDPTKTLDAYQPEKRLQHNVRATAATE